MMLGWGHYKVIRFKHFQCCILSITWGFCNIGLDCNTNSDLFIEFIFTKEQFNKNLFLASSSFLGASLGFRGPLFTLLVSNFANTCSTLQQID